jgi:pimeloyl-ACP methyl ester carboxylesterase
MHQAGTNGIGTPLFFDAKATASTSEADRFEQALSSIRIPLALIRGRSSEVVTASEVARFRMIAPEAQVIEIPDAAHMVAGDQNDAFAEAVLDLLIRALPA